MTAAFHIGELDIRKVVQLAFVAAAARSLKHI
jgi:hypothetical protein